MEQLQKKAIPVSPVCRALGVSHSGYYAARLRSCQAPVACANSVHLKAAFAASGHAYGSRRLRAALKQQGVAIRPHRVRTLMRAGGLRAVWMRKFMHTTDSRDSLAASPSVLARQFEPPNPANGLVVHSERGTQYASAEHQGLLKKHGLWAA